MNGELRHLGEYENVLVTDQHGTIIFYDLADLNVLKEIGLRPEEFMDQPVTAMYQNLTMENSTIMSVLRTGQAVCNTRQELMTKSGDVFVLTGSTYPIIADGATIGAIEFSKHYYEKDNIQSLNKRAVHKVYRKNNTVYTIQDLITTNPAMLAIKRKIERVAPANSNVLLVGRTGTGKEIVAQSIHNLSGRFNSPFVSLNCGAVPPNLLESVLFGTVKGSFTGAVDKKGLFEEADGGTLFLDEINSMEYFLQVKLLKAIEEKTIWRVGGGRPVHVNVRILAAVNEDPELLMAEKRMREDLYYRLSVVQLDLPELRERPEDIELLLWHYIHFYNSSMNMQIESVQPEVLACLQQYHWPGNIRELRNAVETAYHNVSSHEMTLEDLPRRIRESRQETACPPATLKEAVEQYEMQLVQQEWHRSGGKLTLAAEQLGISKQLLKYKIDKYGL
ncbi:sigma-54 interaction domain-containing protein [Ectobacillus ponti]|uniref:Sigma 54-interacting transcriptional regulator n=1 Tax=Ectobacillus ponti TaxID=2961894 RepID=A0AA41X3Y1_9BACI|nr:sigma 54-interacting transcriptional regulator [Ectobacillus ponti]MCP8968287.1 sigma 54-interacting transcriptional regulator [Ectobacillus ponti]